MEQSLSQLRYPYSILSALNYKTKSTNIKFQFFLLKGGYNLNTNNIKLLFKKNTTSLKRKRNKKLKDPYQANFLQDILIQSSVKMGSTQLRYMKTEGQMKCPNAYEDTLDLT